MSSIITKIKNNNARFIFIFVAILFLPLLQMIFGWLEELNLSEGRRLAEMPSFASLNDVRHWDDYLRAYELFFNDHYGFRSYMVKLNSEINLKVFNVSPRNDVIIGKEGWLFYDSPTDGASLKDFYGKANFDHNQLALIRNNLLILENEFAKRNINFIIVMAPNKHTIYSEFLPDYISGNRGLTTAADQIGKIADETAINYIDLRSSLLRAKNNYSYPLYYLTDTHWNNLGAWVAFNEIRPHLVSGKGNDYACECMDTVIGVAENKGFGDLAIYINNQGKMKDYEMSYAIPGSGCSNGIEANKNYRKLAIIGDSFAEKLVYYLSQSFGEVISVKDAKIDFEVIDKEKPDIVIYEFVERYYHNLLINP